MKNALELLKLTDLKFPPKDPKCHSSLIVSENGFLNLTIHYHDKMLDFTLDELDLNKSPEEIISEISGLISKMDN